jgi:glutamate synthase (NADPH) small chain
MKEQEPKKRNKNFDEVSFGYSQEEAINESNRCLQCSVPQCVKGCPVNINIPKFIKEIKENNNQEAIKTIKESNNLPGVCGRVCPQEEQCECKCINKKDPIKIGYLERFAADNEQKQDHQQPRQLNKTVAVIGSGPASLTCAADLATKGYQVTIFEALHDTGGVLRYGIPEFRLPKSIVEDEVQQIEKLGVEIKKNFIIGKTLSLEELKQDYDAIFIGVGAGLPYFMGLVGENLPGVSSANEFLTRINLMRAYDDNYDTPIKKEKQVVVIGGGNVAMDAARSAKRIGSDVILVYRRSEQEMPARDEEIEHAKEEGINFQLLTNPTKILGEEKVEAIECIKMELGPEDDSGRRRPIPIKGSEFKIECQKVIVAIGQGPNPVLLSQIDLDKNKRGYININEKQQTSDPKVFAGGDITGGNATVIKAMGDGKVAAVAIDEFLKNSYTNKNFK